MDNAGLSSEVEKADWVQKHTVSDQRLIKALRKDVDRGEAETIALALELKADLVLLDEQHGRYLAQRMDLEITGMIGILLSAKSQDHIQLVRPYLKQLRSQVGFYISEKVYQRAIALAKESA